MAAAGYGGRWHGRVAVGVIVGGAGAVLVGLVVAHARDTGEIPTPASLLGVAVLLVLLVWGGRSAALASAWLRAPTDPPTDRLNWALWTFVTSALTAGYAWREVVRDLGGGIPTRPLPHVAGGATFAALGAVLIAASALRAGKAHPETSATADRTRGRRPIVAAVSMSATVGLLAAGSVAVVAIVLERAPVSATTTAAADAPPFPGRPEDVLWHWRPPGDRHLHEERIHGTTTGVAVGLSDRVVAIDGATGEEAWTYRRSGASLHAFSASLSGRSLAAIFGSGARDDGHERLVTFDAATGRVGIDRAVAQTEPPLLTDAAVIAREDRSLTAMSLDDGHPMWEWDLPQDCEHRGDTLATATVVLAAILCGDETAGTATFVAIDGATGHEEWRFAGGDDMAYADVRISEDGAHALLSWSSVLQPDEGSALVDVATGEAVPDVHVGYGTMYAAGVLSQDMYTGAYTLTGYDGTTRAVVAPSCADGQFQDATATDDALVEMCRPNGAAPVTIAVTPWDQPADTYQFTDPDLVVDEYAFLSVAPSAILVTNDPTRLIALG